MPLGQTDEEIAAEALAIAKSEKTALDSISRADASKTARATATITVEGQTYQITDKPALVAQLVLQSLSEQDSAAETLRAMLAASNKLRATTGPTPLVARPGAMKQVQDNQYGNRPIIRVMTLNPDKALGAVNKVGGASVIGIFDDWILSDLQESDAEKIDVVETFGSPHLFVAGRYIRKFSFAGSVRAAPVNYQARYGEMVDFEDGTPARAQRLVTTQYDMLRVFYDLYLRASEQAARQSYTEVVVDGQVYTGYIGTMNFHRTADNEQVVPFTFTMFGTGRRGAGDADAEALLSAFAKQKRKSSRLTDLMASAELSAAVGEVTLSVSGSIALGELTPDAPNGAKPAAMPVVQLTAAGQAQRCKVTGPAGARLVYRRAGGLESRPVDNAVCPLGQEEISIEITDYFKFFAATGETDVSKTVPVAAEYTIRADCGATAKVKVAGQLKGQSRVVLRSVKGFLNNNALSSIYEATAGTGAAVASLGSISNAKAFDADNKIPVELKINLAFPDNTPLSADLLAQVKCSIDAVTYRPATGDSLVTSTDELDAGVIDSTQSVAAIVSVVDDVLSCRFSIAAAARQTPLALNGATVSPFVFANRYVFEMFPTISVPGMSGLKKTTLQFTVTAPTTPNIQMFLNLAPGGVVATAEQIVFSYSAPIRADRPYKVTETILSAVRAMSLSMTIGKGCASNGAIPVVTLQTLSSGSTISVKESYGGTRSYAVSAEVAAAGAGITVRVIFTAGAGKGVLLRDPVEGAAGLLATWLANVEKIRMVAPQGSIILAPIAFPSQFG